LGHVSGFLSTCDVFSSQYKDANIQLLDLPGIIEGAANGKKVISQSNRLDVLLIGKGRGRQVIAVARTADLVLMMLDATKGEIQKYVLPHKRGHYQL